MERVQRGLIRSGAAASGRALLAAGLAAALAGCIATQTDTTIRVGGGISATYAVTSTSGILD